jgi:hydrogenase maturation protein HypF
VLACGAWLKNTACLLDGRSAWMSPLHGDLGTPEARAQLLASVARLQLQASGPVEAVAHDLHPDFFSTRVAQQLAQELCVPSIAVQHHHAHIAQVQAQLAPRQAFLGWALDGVGLGADQSAWGGELLRVQGARTWRIGHLPSLLLPGGDVAAREPWRMAAAALHRLGLPADHTLGRTASAHLRTGTLAVIQPASLKGLNNMMARGLNCPATTSAGRWFDAAAGLLGVCWWQTSEAQAAMALEQLAQQWLAHNPAPALDAELIADGLNLDVLMRRMVALTSGLEADAEAYRAMQARAAALFHVALGDALARAAISAAQVDAIDAIALSGGCFFNRVLRARMVDTLEQAGLRVHLPADRAFGDAGLALGQAWVAALTLQQRRSTKTDPQPARNALCA